MKFCHLFSLAGLLQISFWWQTHGNWLHTTSRLLSLLILFSGTLRYSFTLWVLPSGRKWRSICKNRCSECVPIWGRLHRWGRHWRPTSCRHHCAGDWECPMETPPPPPSRFLQAFKNPMIQWMQVFAGSFVVDSARDLGAVANTSKAVSSLSTQFPGGTEESPTVGFHPAAGSAGNFSSSRLTDDHHQSTDMISRGSSLMQTRAVYVTPLQSSPEWGGGFHYLVLPVVFLMLASLNLVIFRMHFL